ncbi:hypothetical protein OROHE_026907 [Orobanche hederae]
MEVGGDERGNRRIKLICPSVSKTVQISACDEQKLDFGSIARAFGLDPSTLKLNGHFISRGVDLIASSVTWKSLTGFFSARGLSTGADDSGALVVDGKFSRTGHKRSHCLEDGGDGMVDADGQGYYRESKRPQHEHCSMFGGEKIGGSISGQSGLRNRTTGSNEANGSSLKRKWLLGDESELKKTKSNSVEAVTEFTGLEERKASMSINRRISCGIDSKSMKRTRDDKMVDASPFKKIRGT